MTQQRKTTVEYVVCNLHASSVLYVLEMTFTSKTSLAWSLKVSICCSGLTCKAFAPAFYRCRSMIFAGLPSKAFSIKKASVAKVHIPWIQNRELTWVQVSAAHDHTTGPPLKNNKNSGTTQTKRKKKGIPNIWFFQVLGRPFIWQLPWLEVSPTGTSYSFHLHDIFWNFEQRA